MTDTPNTTPDDSPMFAPIPAWERNKKRRGFGGMSRAARPAETRSFAAAPAHETEPQIDRVSEVDPANTAFAAPPVYASRSQAKSSSATPVAIVAGLILVGGVATAGWYYTQPHGQTGVAELTPGTTTTTTSDSTTTPAAATPSQVAQNTPPPAAARATTTTRTSHSAAPARTRTASARSSSASDTAADASTTAPMPLPTPGVAPAPAAATAAPAPAAPLVLNIPPAATSPAAQQAAPQPVNPPTAPQTTAPPPTQVPQA
jgi:hypothetical protein